MISLCPLLLSNVNGGGKFKYGGFILHILHSLFDKMLYFVYVHSKNNIPILYIVFLCSFVTLATVL
jgi:hypothetical protein